MLADKDIEIAALKEQCVDKERAITQRDQTIAERDREIMKLKADIDRLNMVISQSGMQAGDLQNQIATLMK